MPAVSLPDSGIKTYPGAKATENWNPLKTSFNRFVALPHQCGRRRPDCSGCRNDRSMAWCPDPKGPYVQCCIHVSIGLVPAVPADKLSAAAVLTVLVPAPVAGLAGVGRIDLHHLMALVDQIRHQHPPGALHDIAVQLPLAGSLAHHCRNLEVLDYHPAGGAGYRPAGLVRPVLRQRPAPPMPFL